MSKKYSYCKISVVAILFIYFILISGCSSPYKSLNVLPRDFFSKKSQNAVNSSSPSWETQQNLRLMFLDKDYHKNHQQVISTVEQMAKIEPTPELRMTLAELSLLEAQKYHKSDPQKASVYYLIAAQQAYDYIFFDTHSFTSSTLTPSFRLMADIYNLAVAELIAIRINNPNRKDTRDFDYEGVSYHFEVIKNGQGVWAPDVFNYIHNSYEVRTTGFTNEYTTKGLGAPLVGIIEKPSEKAGFGQFYPKRLVSYPITGLLLFEPVQNTTPPSRNISLTYYDSFQLDSISIQNRNIPLEADFTTPLGLQFQGIKPFGLGIQNLLKSDKELKNAGLYMLEPYRADKIPVVMVHGLMSSPFTWAQMFNDLRGDPQLRKRYQFWFFMYPTGLPIGYSTSILRDQLNAVKAMYDPNGTNQYFNQMVLVGHSMGGLLSRGMVQDSGTAYWDYFFKEPFDTITLDPNAKQIFNKIMFYEHLPFVKRVVFISTPHRGSSMADKWYTKMLSGMVGLPNMVSDTVTSVANKDVLNQSVAPDYTKKVPNSLTLLAPSSAFIKVTNTIPLRTDIPYHSIIGIRNAKTGPGSSDSVVPYESSHLDFVQSEKLVPSKHGAHEHPLAIAEVKRILHEHLKTIPSSNKTETAITEN